jgi:hypothetical protein
MIRRLSAALAALALLLTMAVPVLAGGWAEIVADAQTTEPPVEGQPVGVGFLVLQHGETPAGWETPTVHFTDASTGETIDAAAKNDRPDGHFTASVTLPHAGYWSWQVTLQDLESNHVPVMLTVRTATGALPPFDPTIALTAIERARGDVATQVTENLMVEIGRLDSLREDQERRISALQTQVSTLTAERDALASGGDSGSLPILAVVTLAVLAGALAGFAMSWLAGRPGPRVALREAPRGVDPA